MICAAFLRFEYSRMLTWTPSVGGSWNRAICVRHVALSSSIFKSGISGSVRMACCDRAVGNSPHFRGWQLCLIVWNVRMAWTTLSSFDEISILFEKTQQSLGPRYVVWNIGELSRTISRFHQNNDNVVQVRRRFVPKMGRVADGCYDLLY